jgi:hypothetical protein
MADKSRTLKLNILAETKDLTDGLKRANVDVNNASTGMSDAFKKVGVALAAATAAAGAYAVKLAVDGVKAAIEDQAAQERLANALRNTTAATDAQIASIEKQILATSLATGIADDQLRPAFQRLAVATGDLGQSQNLLNLALDISAATGKSVESVTNALGRAYEGSTTALTRLGIGLSAAEIETLGLEGAVSQLSATFGGSAAVQAETLEGQIARLKVSFDETKESIGTALLPILTDLFNEFADFAIPAAERFAEVFQEDLVPYLERQVFPAFGELIEAIKGIGDAFDNTSQDVQESNAIIQALETTIIEFVPTTLGALEVVTDAWATFLDVLNRARAFISGDLETATREFNNRFAETEKVTNNVNDAMVNAYKQFEFFNRENRENTLPINEQVIKSNDRVSESTRRVAAASREATEALRQEFTAKQSLDLIRSGFGSAVGVSGGGGSLPGGESVRSAAQLVSQFGGFVPGFNQLPTDPFFGFGRGSDIRNFQRGGGGVVNINVSGTVIDPEGAARAIEELISNSNARGGAQFQDLFGVNP